MERWRDDDGSFAVGCTFPAGQPIARRVSDVHREVVGRDGRHWSVPALTDARFYTLYGGAQATCYGPEADLVHCIDESVGLASVHATTRVLALTMAGRCGVERAG